MAHCQLLPRSNTSLGHSLRIPGSWSHFSELEYLSGTFNLSLHSHMRSLILSQTYSNQLYISTCGMLFHHTILFLKDRQTTLASFKPLADSHSLFCLHQPLTPSLAPPRHLPILRCLLLSRPALHPPLYPRRLPRELGPWVSPITSFCASSGLSVP